MKDFKFLFEKYALGQHRPERQIQKYLSKIHGRIAFDIGAFHGQYSKVFSKHFQYVLAFEPDPDAAKFLESRNLPNVKVYQLALSDKDGETDLYRYDGLFCPGIMETFNLYRQLEPQSNKVYDGKSVATVKTGTYDDFASDAMVDLVKIDVEGAEFKVLDGMEKAFTNHKVRRIIVELHDNSRRWELTDLLGVNQFRLFWLDSTHVFGKLED